MYMVKFICYSVRFLLCNWTKLKFNEIRICNTYSTEQHIFGHELCPPKSLRNKVSVIGLGHVAEALIAFLLFNKITNNIALVGRSVQKLRNFRTSFQQISHVDASGIDCSDDYSIVKNSHICVVTLGIPRKPGTSRMDGLKATYEMIAKCVPQIAKHAPESILIIVSNPVDVITYVSAKIADFPRDKVFGSGTHLDTIRMRHYMSQKYGVECDSCKGWVLGEHGETSVVAFSTCTVGGVFISDTNSKMGEKADVDNWNDIYHAVLTSGLTVADEKGYTNWAIGLCVADMVRCILNNSMEVFALSVSAKGYYNIKENVYLSLPVVLGENGIVEIVKLQLSDNECKKLHLSAKRLYAVQNEIKF